MPPSWGGIAVVVAAGVLLFAPRKDVSRFFRIARSNLRSVAQDFKAAAKEEEGMRNLGEKSAREKPPSSSKGPDEPPKPQ